MYHVTDTGVVAVTGRDPSTCNLPRAMATEVEHFRLTYNDVHNIIKKSAEKINEFKPDLVIAIGREILISYAPHFS